MSRLVEEKDLGVFSRLRAKLGIHKKIGNMFLGHCSSHNVYFIDLEHTNGVIRCPLCDEAWLKKYARIEVKN